LEARLRDPAISENDKKIYQRQFDADLKEYRLLKAGPPPRVGMTKLQFYDGTNWGTHYTTNKTSTAKGIREQLIFETKLGGRRYLYFENDVLTAIQE
jgi:hypothetical protein